MPPFIEEHRQELAEICRNYHVKRLELFGSGARGELRADSDVDLLVEFVPEAPVGLIEFNRLQQALERILSRRVDLVPRRGLKPWLRESVERDCELVYAG